MEIRTYTRIWTAGKTLYTIGDITLPRPIPLMALGVFVIGILVWTVPLFMFLPIPLSSPYAWLFGLSVPVFIAWSSNKPIFEKKPLFEYLESQFGFMNETPYFEDMRPSREEDGQIYSNTQQIWSPQPPTQVQNSSYGADSKQKKRRRGKKPS